MKSQEITDGNFEAIVLKSEKLVLVDFGAEWCPPCRAMSPLLDVISEEVEGKALVATLDVDANPEVAARYGVRNLPTFLVFKQGEVVEKIVGAVPRHILAEKLTSHL